MFCPYCGTNNDANAAACHVCGARLPNRAPQAPYPQQPNPEMPKTTPIYPQDIPQADPWQAAPPQGGGYQQPQRNPAYQQPQQNPGYQQPQQNPGYQQPQQGYVHPQSVQEPAPRAPKAAPRKKPQLKAPAFLDKLKNVDFKKFFAKNSKLMVILGGAVAALLVVILVISLLGGGSDVELHKAWYLHIFDNDKGTFDLYYGGELVADGLDDYRSTQYSMDGTVRAYLTYEDELLLVREDGEVSVEKNVDAFALGSEGNAIVYIDEDKDLYLYDTNKDKAEKIGENAVFATLSPDGKTVAYTMREDDEVYTYLYDGKESRELIEDFAPMGLTNGGKTVYCVNEDADVYAVNSKGEKEKISSDVNLGAKMMFNRDHTQFWYCSKGKWYIWDGEDSNKLSGKEDSCYVVTHWEYASCGYMVTTMSDEDLGNHFYRCGDVLYYVDGKLESEKVASDVASTFGTLDSKTVFYTDSDNTLYKVSAPKLEEVEIAEDVEDFVVAHDGSYVYYVDEDDTLFYRKGTKDPVEIEDDVSNVYITHDGYVLFLVDYRNNSGDLFSSRNGGKSEEVMNDVYKVTLFPDATYIYTEYESQNDFELLFALKGTKFQEVK